MLFHSFKNKILVCVLIMLFGVNNFCLANTIETQLSHDQVTLGDSVFVTYISNNHNFDNSPDFSALQKDFRILNTNYGNAINTVNGVTSAQNFWRFQLEPKRAGELIVPEISFGRDKSTAHKLVVTASQVISHAQASAVSAQQNTPVFVRAGVSTSAPYVQSQVLYTFKLYFRNQLREPRLDIPEIHDLTVLQLGEQPAYQTTINGETYNVVEKTFAIFPKKSGAITIAPMQLHAFTAEQNTNVFDNPFNFYEPKAISVATQEVNLSVRDVPPNYAGTAWLPAKNISLTEQWSDNSKHWEAGTPVTRTITLEAQGLRADQLPDISIDKINGMNVYVDRPKRSNTIQNDMVIGILEQTVTYIPNTTQSFTIPPIKINWWNTKTDANAVAQLPGVNVQVKGGVNVSNSPADVVSTPVLTPANTVTKQEIKIISNTFYPSIWFWIACALFTVWLVTLWLWLRKKTVYKNEAPTTTPTTIEISAKDFEQACRAGHAIKAQQYLLSWAKKQWPHATSNLAKLNDLINDEPFQLAIQELEKALYARKDGNWDGAALLAAFQRIKKTRKSLDRLDTNFNKHLPLADDPLPPLNPLP